MSLILDRVRQAQRLTTVTPADRPSTERNFDGFSVENAIVAHVQRLDLIRWAREETPERLVPELPYQRPTRLALVRFMKGVIP